MAKVTIRHRFAHSDVLEVGVGKSYPDAVAEAKACALSAFRTALGLDVEILAADDEDTST